MLIAGPVFPEWYWTPIILAIVYGPPVLVVAGLLYLAGRRRFARRGRRAAASLALATVIVMGVTAAWQQVRFERAEAAKARQIAFATYEPRGWSADRAGVRAGPQATVNWTYRRGGSHVFVTQSAAPVELDPPRCVIPYGARYIGYSGPCRAGTTPGGRRIVFAGDHVVASLEGTVVTAWAYPAARDALLAYVDALEPVAVTDIDFKR